MTRAVLDTFESALLAELRDHVAERSAAPSVRPFRRRLVAVAAAAAVATVAVGAVGLRSSPAFAVQREPDGDVVVTIRQLSDAAGLERALADQGITAEVSYDARALTPSDVDHGGPAPRCATLMPADVLVDPADGGGFTFTLDAAFVAAHDTVLHLTTAGGPTAEDWMAVSVRWEVSSRCRSS